MKPPLGDPISMVSRTVSRISAGVPGSQKEPSVGRGRQRHVVNRLSLLADDLDEPVPVDAIDGIALLGSGGRSPGGSWL